MINRRRALMAAQGEDEMQYKLHEVEFEISSATTYSTILNTYIQECIDWCYFPTDGNTALSTVARGTKWPLDDRLGDTGNAAGNTAIASNVPQTMQYTVNDQTYSATRSRGNVNNLPAGSYKLKFYGIAK